MIKDSRITGTLKNITDGSVWDSGTWGADESTGHFLFVKADHIPEGATVTVQLLNGKHGPVTLDEDLNVVLRITDKSIQRIRMVANYGGFSESRIYSLGGLTLA